MQTDLFKDLHIGQSVIRTFQSECEFFTFFISLLKESLQSFRYCRLSSNIALHSDHTFTQFSQLSRNGKSGDPINVQAIHWQIITRRLRSTVQKRKIAKFKE